MPSLFTEDTYEQAIIELFENMGYDHLYAPDFDRDYTSPLLDSVLNQEKPDIAIITGDVVTSNPAKEGWKATPSLSSTLTC